MKEYIARRQPWLFIRCTLVPVLVFVLQVSILHDVGLSKAATRRRSSIGLLSNPATFKDYLISALSLRVKVLGFTNAMIRFAVLVIIIVVGGKRGITNVVSQIPLGCTVSHGDGSTICSAAARIIEISW